MKKSKTDISLKYIIFELEGKEYALNFRTSLLKGVYDVSMYGHEGKADIKVLDTYPPLKRLIYEFRRVYVPLWISGIVNKCRQLYNR